MTVGGIAGYVQPTGTIGATARQDVVGIYRGILAGEPAPDEAVFMDNRWIALFGILMGDA